MKSLVLRKFIMLTFIRHLSATSLLCKYDKYYKITKYIKKIDTTVYKEGDIIDNKVIVPKFKQHYPDYPYETRFYKQQNRGLYGGLQRTTGKTCSESKNKNLRTRKPNIVTASLYSEVLDKVFKVKVATRVLKTITKEGGLDKYVLKDKSARIKTMGKVAWRIKYDIMMKQASQELNIGNTSSSTVYHIDKKGRKIIVGRKKLLASLYPFVRVDNYIPINYKRFLANHTYKTTDEIIELLDHYGYDFSEITLPSITNSNSTEPAVNA